MFPCHLTAWDLGLARVPELRCSDMASWLPASQAAMKKTLEGAILTDKPNVKWDDVAGLAGAKDALKETVLCSLVDKMLYSIRGPPPL